MNVMIIFIKSLDESIAGQLLSNLSQPNKFGGNFTVSNAIGDGPAMLLWGLLGVIPLLMVAFLLWRRNL